MRLARLLLSPDHSTLTIEAESGDRLIVKPREGDKLKVEFAPKQPEQPPHAAEVEARHDVAPKDE